MGIPLGLETLGSLAPGLMSSVPFQAWTPYNISAEFHPLWIFPISLLPLNGHCNTFIGHTLVTENSDFYRLCFRVWRSGLSR